MLYPAVLFIHVIAGVLLVGHSLLAPVIRRGIENADSLPALRSLLLVDRRVGALNPFAALILLGSGIYLGSAGSWSAGWFYVSIVLWVADSALAAAVVNRAGARAAAAAAAEAGIAIPASVDALRRSRAWTVAEAIIAGNDVAVVYLMMAKPDLLTSCVAVIAGVTMALLVVRVFHARPAAMPSLDPAS